MTVRSSSATPSPVFAEMRRTSSGSIRRSSASSFARRVRLGGRQVDLVHGRHDHEAGVPCEVVVGEGLGLEALGGVDQQDRALAGREASARPRR